MSLTVLIDYESGNLHSAHKAFERMAAEVSGGEILVSGRAEDIARADRVVLPGEGGRLEGAENVEMPGYTHYSYFLDPKCWRLVHRVLLGLERSAVYICNIVKCRPPGNRTPLADEVSACRPFLDGQIDAVRPKVIVALGKPAASLLLGRDIAITRVRGTWHDYRGIPLMPTFHPAFILRQYTEQNRRLVWDDLKSALARARE